MKQLFLLPLGKNEKKNSEAIEKQVKEHVSVLESRLGKPLKDMDVEYLVHLIRSLYTLLLTEMECHSETAARERIMDAAIEVSARGDKKRIYNRRDQVDKRAFEEAVLTNIDDYPNIAEAIRDLQIKPQFARYPEGRLRLWANKVWHKPIE